MTGSETFPGGLGHDPEEDRLFKGGVRTPRAISRRSCCALKSLMLTVLMTEILADMTTLVMSPRHS